MMKGEYALSDPLQSENLDNQQTDYGFYSDMCSDLSRAEFSKKLFQLREIVEAKPSNAAILCVIEDHKAPVACRSFQSIQEDTHEVQISIPGYRLVYEDGKHYAEYQVKLTIFDEEFVAWRKYEHFVTFATAFSTFQREIGSKDERLERIIGAWYAVVRHRPWFQISLNIGYYVSEMSLLNKFLNTTLYNSPHYELIVEFFC